MFNFKFNRTNTETQATLAELDALADAFTRWQHLSQSYEVLHAELMVEALTWLAIDPDSEGTQNYVSTVSSQLDELEAEWAATETKIMFAREIGMELETEVQ